MFPIYSAAETVFRFPASDLAREMNATTAKRTGHRSSTLTRSSVRRLGENLPRNLQRSHGRRPPRIERQMRDRSDDLIFSDAIR
jgi:hypothetical protein